MKLVLLRMKPPLSIWWFFVLHSTGSQQTAEESSCRDKERNLTLMAACALNVFPLVKEKALEENSFY